MVSCMPSLWRQCVALSQYCICWKIRWRTKIQTILQIFACFAFFICIIPGLALSEEADEQNNIIVCYEYSCARVGLVELTGPEWNKIVELFKEESETPHQERQKISNAIALMEQLTGKKLDTSNDKAENAITDEPGQMDCIDESINTTRYLRYFVNKGWIKWHKVENRIERSPFFFDVHWTAAVTDKSNNQVYAIDSWFRDNGREPVIITLQDWKAKKEKP